MKKDFDSRSTNAGEWARAFCKMNPAMDKDIMLGWFADAIDAGRNMALSVSAVESNKKSKPRSYRIVAINDTQVRFTGWHRKDLDAQHENWHYYESTDGKMYHFRSEHMVAVEEEVPTP